MLEIRPKMTVRKGKTYRFSNIFDFFFRIELDSALQQNIIDALVWSGTLVFEGRSTAITVVDGGKEIPKSGLFISLSKNGSSIIIPSETDGIISLSAAYDKGDIKFNTAVKFVLQDDLSRRVTTRSGRLQTDKAVKFRQVRDRYNPPSME